MDRFSWCDGSLYPEEKLVERQTGVGVYDGQDKTAFNNGQLMLTTHRLMWRDQRNRNCVISVPLASVKSLDEQPSGFTKSAKIIVYLAPAISGQLPGPVTQSAHDYIRLSFRELGQVEFYRSLKEEIQKKNWEKPSTVPGPSTMPNNAVGMLPRQRPGIVGIERSLQQKNKETNKNISKAFQDLNNLMDKAKEMVSLSKAITNKIKDKQGEITEDETIKFKSYLLSMGIPDPVTRETHTSDDKYYSELAKQLATLLSKPIDEAGGMMTLTDVYCRVNRARGMEVNSQHVLLEYRNKDLKIYKRLLSPEDLLHACETMEIMQLPVRLRIFDSGVAVLQAQSQNEEEIVEKTTAVVNDKGSLTAEQLAQILGLSVILAKERLLLTETLGGVCRDDTVEGLRFFPNLFLTV